MVPAVDMDSKTKPGYKQLRIAWSDNFGDIPVSDDTRMVLEQFIDKLADEGCTVKKINPAHFDFSEVWETWGKMVDLQINVNLPSSARFIMYTLGGIQRSKSPLLQMVYPATYEKFIEVCRRWHDMELLEISEMVDAVAGAYKEPPGY